MRPVELEVGDEIVVLVLDGVARVVELAVDPIDILGPDGGVPGLVAFTLESARAVHQQRAKPQQ